MKFTGLDAMSHRLQQLESTLKRRIAEILSAGLADPRLRGLISVTGVKLTADKRTAVVGISVMPAEVEQTSLRALQHAAAHIRHQVSETIKIRQMPQLQFKLDPTIKKQAQVISAINQAMQDVAQPVDDSPADDPDDLDASSTGEPSR